VKPPRASAAAGVGEVELRFTRPEGAASFQILRAVGATGVLVPLTSTVPAVPPFTYQDAMLENDVVHRYQVVAIGPRGELSAPSATCEAIPRLDPYPPAGSIRLEGEAAETAVVDVVLVLSAADNLNAYILDELPRRGLASGVQAMQISNRSDFLAAQWEPYAPARSWTLEPDSEGTAFVFARFRDGAGNVSQTANLVVRVVSGPGGIQRTGDCNQDGRLDISDGICLLGHLFLGSPRTLPCDGGSVSEPGNKALLNVNGDAIIDLSDPVRLLGFLFLGSSSPVLGKGCVPIAGCPENAGRCVP
jgi:hypothetical protein